MTAIRFIAMPTDVALAYRSEGRDAYGLQPERLVSTGGLPCRHCLTDISQGDDALVAAYRPFSGLQPYAETGPVFLHVQRCERCPETEAVPEMLSQRPQLLIRGYDCAERIVYGTGDVIQGTRIADESLAMLEREDVSFVHLRSANNNCFLCRVECEEKQP